MDKHQHITEPDKYTTNYNTKSKVFIIINYTIKQTYTRQQNYNTKSNVLIFTKYPNRYHHNYIMLPTF